MKAIDRYSIGLDFAGSERWPLQLVVFGDFQPRDGRGESAPLEPSAYAIDKDSFDDVLPKIAGELPLIIENSNTFLSESRWIQVPLRNIRSFHPDALVKAIPNLGELLIIRKRAAEFADGKLSFEQFQAQVKNLRAGIRILDQLRPAERVPEQNKKGGREKSTSKRMSRAARSDELVDSILGIVDLPDAGRAQAIVSPTTPGIKSLISEIAESGSAGVTGKSSRVHEVIRELDRMLSDCVGQILHNPEFRRLEALWRGLKHLVDRTDFREPIRIEIRPCAKQNLPDSFTLFVNQMEARGGLDSDTIVLASYEFDPSPRDMQILRQISEMAKTLQAPLISSVGLDFFGFESAHDFERISGLSTIFNQSQYAKWRALREAESSRWLTLLFNRFLLRYPYSPDQVRVKSFEYSETVSASHSNIHLWGNPVWGMGSLLTKRFAASGDCLDITGWEKGLIEDLPIRKVQLKNGDAIQSPVEALISEDLLGDFTGEGITALVSRMNTDTAAVLSVPTAHLPERYGNEEETRLARLRAFLPYQLFVSRFAVCARRLAHAIGPGLAPDTMSTLIGEILLEFVPGKKDVEAVKVNVNDSVQFPDFYDVTLILEPALAGWQMPTIQMQLLVHR